MLQFYEVVGLVITKSSRVSDDSLIIGPVSFSNIGRKSFNMYGTAGSQKYVFISRPRNAMFYLLCFIGFMDTTMKIRVSNLLITNILLNIINLQAEHSPFSFSEIMKLYSIVFSQINSLFTVFVRNIVNLFNYLPH